MSKGGYTRTGPILSEEAYNGDEDSTSGWVTLSLLCCTGLPPVTFTRGTFGLVGLSVSFFAFWARELRDGMLESQIQDISTREA